MDVGRRDVELEDARFDFRQVENLVDQVQQTLVVGFHDVVELLSFFRIVTFGNQL